MDLGSLLANPTNKDKLLGFGDGGVPLVSKLRPENVDPNTITDIMIDGMEASKLTGIIADARLGPLNIVENDLLTDCVTTTKIKNLHVSDEKISGMNGSKLTAGSVPLSKMKIESVSKKAFVYDVGGNPTTSEITDQYLADNAVTTTKLVNESVTN